MIRTLCFLAVLLDLSISSKIFLRFQVDTVPLKMTDAMLAEKLGEGLIEEYMSLANDSFKDISNERNKNQACRSEDFVEQQKDDFPWFIRHVRCSGIGRQCNQRDVSYTCLQTTIKKHVLKHDANRIEQLDDGSYYEYWEKGTIEVGVGCECSWQPY